MNDRLKARIKEVLDVPRNRRLYDRLKATYEETSLCAHGWDHVHRVFVNALLIGGETGNVNLDIVVPAALLHDIGFLYDPNPAIHNTLGAERCLHWLDEWNETEKIAIVDCIRKHKGMMEGFMIRPGTEEERVVCDADLLEKTGYVGALQGLRTFVEFGEGYWKQYRSLYEIVSYLRKVKNLEFFTSVGKALSEAKGGMNVRIEIFEKAMEELADYY